MSDSEIKREQWRPDAEESSTAKNYALSGKIMLTSILILFVVVVFLVLLHLYARWYLLRLHRHNTTTRRRNLRNRSSRIIFYVENSQSSPPTGGLQLSVLNSLPMFVYSSKNDENEGNGENTPECAVCLAEFEDGETGRLLPKCKHSFHTECIDMWFFSHSTCPLCRSPVEPVEIEPELKVIGEHGSSSEVSQATSMADRRKGIDFRIDVPSRNELVTETESPSQEFKSPGSRLMSFKRIINMNRKSPAVSPSSGVGPSSLPVAAESDLESTMQESEHESTQTDPVIFR